MRSRPRRCGPGGGLSFSRSECAWRTRGRRAGRAEKARAALDEPVDDRSSATDLLGEAAEAVASLARIDATLSGVETEAQALLERAGDLGRRLRVYREGVGYNPKRPDEGGG